MFCTLTTVISEYYILSYVIKSIIINSLFLGLTYWDNMMSNQDYFRNASHTMEKQSSNPSTFRKFCMQN